VAVRSRDRVAVLSGLGFAQHAGSDSAVRVTRSGKAGSRLEGEVWRSHPQRQKLAGKRQWAEGWNTA
jgi:hypothetical protein